MNRSQVTSHKSQVVKRTARAFTLVELLAAVAVVAVGMVFVLGALNQCLSSMTTAERTVVACGLLNERIQEVDAAYLRNNGSQEGFWAGDFEGPSYAAYNWTHEVRPIAQDFGNQTIHVQDDLNEDTITVAWKQGEAVKDVSVHRFVRRKRE